MANLLFRHSQEEREHAIKFMKYIFSRGGTPDLQNIEVPELAPSNIVECFESLVRHEFDNSASINSIVSTAFEEQDWASWNFLQWFVKEQIEEETLVVDLLDKVQMAG